MDNHAEQTYYESMNLITAPVRFAFDAIKMVLLVVILLGIAICFPFYLLLTGQPVSETSILCCIWAFMAIISLICAPCFTVLVGIGGLFTLGVLADNHENFVYNTFFFNNHLFYWSFAFFAFSILQRYVIHELCKEPPYQKNPDAQARYMGQMGALQFETHRILHGDDYSKWPKA